MKRLLIILALLLAMRASASADSASGPERTTVINKSWGTIYHLPMKGGAEFEPNLLGEYTLQRSGGLVSIRQEGRGDGYWITYPDRKELIVTVDSSEIKVKVNGQWCSVRFSASGFEAQLPHDTIRLRQNGHKIQISGKLGTTLIQHSAEGLEVTSNAGETHYARNSDGVFQLRGIPLNGHPYVCRGIYFETEDVGAFISFHLDERCPGFSMLDWFPMIMVK